MQSEINTLTTAEKQELENFIFTNLVRTNQPASRLSTSVIVFEFSTKFSLPALYRFMVWMLSHGYTAEEVFPTIVHDLNGSNQDPHTFSPRISSY